MPGLTAAKCHMIGSDLHVDRIPEWCTPYKQKADTRTKSHVTETLPQHTFCVTRFTVHRDMEWTSSRVIQDPPQRQVGPARLKYMMKMKFNVNMAAREKFMI